LKTWFELNDSIRRDQSNYSNLNNLKKVNNVDSFNLYSNFVKKFALLKNAKEKKIPNFIDIKIENYNNIVKENNNSQKFRYIT